MVSPTTKLGFIFFQKQFPGGFKGGDDIVNAQIQKTLVENSVPFDVLPVGSESVRLAPLLSKLLRHPVLFYRPTKEEKHDLLVCNGDTILFSKGVQILYISHISRSIYRKNLGWLGGLRGVARNLVMFYQSLIQNWNLRRARVIAVSDFLKMNLVSLGVPVEKVITNAVDLKKFSPAVAISPDKKNGHFLYAGGFAYYGKGFDILHRLADKLEGSGREIHCLTNRDPGGKLKWRQHVPHEQMADFYRQYALLIFPSRYESLGMVAIEAMACGTPAVMGPVGVGYALQKEMPELIVPHWNKGCEDLYLEKINGILAHYEETARKGRAYVEAHHALVDFQKAWLEVLR
jgi:glycosyltransferase involved in cell wall biosynthesis